MTDTDHAMQQDVQHDAARTTEATVFCQVLLVMDESSEARAAASYASGLSRQFGAGVATVMVTEAKARQRAGHLGDLAGHGRGATTCTVSGPTEGARSHTLATEIAHAAEASGADVIVLGLSRARLARHRLAPNLRSLVAQATEVPVLLAPVAWGEATPGGTDQRPDVDPFSAERVGLAQRGRYVGV
jgi:nucleotide-binding universal stress UspA family protein